MAHSDDPVERKPPADIKDLITEYQKHREAWRAQARDLERMRDQVHAAAAEEAREIVANTRRDVRRILIAARRELLVLAAQAQAAAEAADALTPPNVADSTSAPAAMRLATPQVRRDLDDTRDVLVEARRDIHKVLDDASPELNGLAAEARALRASLQRSQLHGGRGVADDLAANDALRFNVASHEPASDDSAPGDTRERDRTVDPPAAALTEIPVMLAPDERRQTRPSRALLVMLIAAGIAASISAFAWYARSPTPEAAPRAVAPPQPPASTPKTQEQGTTPPVAASTSPTPSNAPSARPSTAPLSILLEARRPVWILTTADGHADKGLLLQAGEKRQISAAESVVLRVGDAGAVFVSLNGGAPEALGPDGQVVTRDFKGPVEHPAP